MMLNFASARNTYVIDVTVIYISIRIGCGSHESIVYVENSLFLAQGSRAYQIKNDSILR